MRSKVPRSIERSLLRGWLSLILLLFCSTSMFSQISMDLKDKSVKEILKEIERKSNYNFFYSEDLKDLDKVTSIQVSDATLEKALGLLLKDTRISFKKQDSNIVLLIPKGIVLDKDETKKYSGIVIDKNREPIIGASVTIKGTTTGTVTDVDGKFNLNVLSGATLVISYLGYTTQEITAWNQTNLTITLVEDLKVLEEVVVVGYGTQKKVNLTGAISTINVEKEAESRPFTNLSQAFSGMSAGVQTMQSTGKPNSDAVDIRIRGVGTLNNSSPLVIVDGMELSLNDVNPNDVASISILKDAASCAIYGNRGANGVILITTKEGQEGKVSVNYSGFFSLNQPSNLNQLVNNSADYFELINESAYNIGQSNVFSQSTIDMWRAAEKDPNGIDESGYPNYVAYPNTDWYKELFQNKLMSEHTVSVVGASNKVNYNFSGTYLDNPGLVQGTGLQKYYIRSNISVKVRDWLTIGNRSHGYVTNQERNDVDAFTGGLHGQKLPPDIYPKYDGKYGLPEAPEEDPTSSNPFALLAVSGGSFEHNQINTAMFADATLFNDFVYHAEFDYMRYRYDAMWLSKQSGRFSFRQNRMVEQPTALETLAQSLYNQGSNRLRFVETLTWRKTIGVHEIGALAGYEEISNWGRTSDMAKSGATDPSLTDLSTYTTLTFITGNTWEYASRSFFGRATYAYNSRYLLEVNTRYDGSSRFAPKSRWGVFPSLSGGWRLSEEAFMAEIPLDNLKLRLSWGKLGNNSIGDYEWQSTYASSNYIFGDKLVGGLSQTVLANPNLHWESVTQSNVGLDFAALNNRLSGEIDVYNKVTDGILYRPNTYATVGNKTPARQNFAEVTNRGIESTLKWSERISNFSYSISGNFSYNKNWVSKFKGQLKEGWTFDDNGNRIYKTNLGDVSDGGDTRIIEGHTISEYYLKEPYKGDGSYNFNNGMVKPTGGPKDGMIRTEQDMEWLKAMQAEGYTFYPNQSIGKANLWYGDYIYADSNGDGIYGNSYDRNFQGLSSTPKYFYGLQASASWKNIDFSMNWQGAAGFGIYWNTVGQNSTSTIIGYGISQNLKDDHYFYDPDNPSDIRTNTTSISSRLTLNQTNQATEASALHLERGDFLKLRNLTIGYTLPQKWMQKIYVDKMRIYASGENLLTITKFSGMDPEMRTGMGYVTMRQLAFGVNINF